VSYVPQEWRPLARFGWGGKAASVFRGAVTMDRDEVRSWHAPQTWGPSYRGHGGTVEFRYVGVSVNRSIIGVTRDSAGTAIGNCDLDLYMTHADTLAQQRTSDASGNFQFYNPGSGPYYIVAYKTGAPDLAGTTVNTLVAT
jgi:hypothetical protein